MTKCLECEFDITSLFGMSNTLYVQCPECHTEQRLNNQGQLQVKKSVRTFHHTDRGKVKEITVIGQATDQEIADANRAKCDQCGTIVDMFKSYLVKLRSKYFPKFITNEIHDTDDGIVVTPKVSFRPPVPIKMRLCDKCFNLYKPNEFIKDSNGVADIEQLYDPINKMRDGLRFVPISQSMKASKYEADIVDKPYEHKGKVYEEQAIGFDFSINPQTTTVSKLRWSRGIPGQVYKVAVPSIPRRTPYKPKPEYMRVHPTKTVRWNKDYFPWIGFAPNKERRRAFLKRVAG